MALKPSAPKVRRSAGCVVVTLPDTGECWTFLRGEGGSWAFDSYGVEVAPAPLPVPPVVEAVQVAPIGEPSPIAARMSLYRLLHTV